MIKKLLAILTAGLLAVGLLVSQAGAQVLNGADCVFTFDRTYAGGGNLSDPLAVPLGTMSFTDVGNEIEVNIALDSTYTSISGLFLNYDFGSGPALTTLTLSNSTTWTAGVVANDVPADGYSGRFDMKLSSGSTTQSLPFSGTLSLNGGLTNIDPSFFLQMDTNNLVYAAMLVNFEGGSRYIFASTAECAPVPEPSTLLLLGAGLAGLAGVSLRRRKSG